MIDAINILVEQLAQGQQPKCEQAPELARPLLETLLRGPAPRETLLNLRRIALVAPPDHVWPASGPSLQVFANVLSSGPGLTALITARPQRLAWLRESVLGQVWSRERLVADLAPRLNPTEIPVDLNHVAQVLAAFRNDHYLRLAACEFGLCSLESVCRQLSDLADVCLQAALDAVLSANTHKFGPPIGADDGHRATIAAIAMGKYGAQELNFCSDIDLVFIYSTDDGSAGERSLHEFFTVVCRDVVRILSEQNSEGFAFRVDLRLRPEGSRGPICNSFAGAERYYETWGGPYDRLAWLKARVAAGDRDLGEAMRDVLHPFVFPRITSFQIIDQIQHLSMRIRTELRGQRLVDGWNVKLDCGGIRDIEFFVQALQLMYAGKRPALQERSTLRALDRLLFSGLIAEDERAVLAEAYDLYRRIEHRLQLHGGRQTHLLPGSGPLRDQVVGHLGYQMADFESELAVHREQVSEIYATLGTPPEADSRLAPLLEDGCSLVDAERLLSEQGFADARRAAERLATLTSKPWGPFGNTSDARIRALAQPLLRELAASPDPDAALGHLVDLTLRIGPFEGAWVMFAESEAALRVLCNLFGTSDFLARLFVGQPELLDELLLATRSDAEFEPSWMASELERRVDEAEDLEQRFGALEKFRNEEVLRIGLDDIAGGTAPEAVWQQLSDLAEQILRMLFRIVYEEMRLRYGSPRCDDGKPARMAVIGLGKLGGREMNYGSDLDLIFIYSAEGQTDSRRKPIANGEFFARVAQRLIRALTTGFVHGALYQVDARLRPSGSQGTLVCSRAAFERYHCRAQIWERQVLIKARPVAGHLEFCGEMDRWIQEFVYGDGVDPDEVGKEIARLRSRMEAELANETSGAYNLKLGRGGLIEVEFAAQYFQLLCGRETPAFRTRSTMEALATLRQTGLVDEAQVLILEDGYRFLRLLEGRLRIVRGQSAEHLPALASGLEVVARRLGYRRHAGDTAGEQLLADYRRRTAAIRNVYERIFSA